MAVSRLAAILPVVPMALAGMTNTEGRDGSWRRPKCIPAGCDSVIARAGLVLATGLQLAPLGTHLSTPVDHGA